MSFIAKDISWKLILFLIFFLNLNQINAEEVCKLFYNGCPEDINSQVIEVGTNTVALSEHMKVGRPQLVLEPPPDGVSIFFIIDNSASMTKKYKDRLGNRFTVLYDLIDTIYQRMPLSEVGLAVFRQDLVMTKEDSPHFVKPPKWKNAYLKLMKLDKTYENNEKGFDIIRKYLEAEVNAEGIAEMKYKASDPLPYQQYKTNINCGFDAAKDALSKSIWGPHKRFIIFISDGEANQPQDGTKNDFAKGTDVPTTYTIYFPKDEDVPESIKIMTENVKKNNYSASNPLSKYWRYKNTSKDKLKQFMMDNILYSILTKKEKRADKFFVNGKSAVSIWQDSLGFTFEKMFPLTGIKTDFSQKIHYKVITDSVSSLTGQKTQGESESVESFSFSVKINERPQLDSNSQIECWDRKLQFFYNNNPIDIADETMNELEIRFIEDKVDIFYGYENVSVDINNTETPKNDLEKFKMENKGSYFTYKFKRNFESAELGDKNLSHAYEDSIIATFRNPDLPLDTVRYGIPFRISGTVGIKTGYYHDNDADGYVDSLFLEYKGKINKEQARELIDHITLPAHRGFELVEAMFNDEGIGMTVRQKDIVYDDKMVTYVTKEDVLSLREGILPSGGWVIPESVEIQDRVAPIIMKAELVDFEDPAKEDILTVTFSEPVLKVTKRKPFYFWKSNPKGLLYTADLQLKSNDATKMIFTVKSLKGITEPIIKVHENDSIWIFWENKQVCDKLFNYQHNENNRKRLLFVDQRYSAVDLLPKGVNPYDRNNPENHIIPPQIIEILKKDNVSEIGKGSDPNTGMLLKVFPLFSETIDMDAVTDFFLKGIVTIFDPTGNTVIHGREMGYHEKTKTLNFVWNGKNASNRACGTGPYLALFKVTQFRGPNKKNIGDKTAKLLIYVK